jgi:tRNA-dihydrouridine synthase A
MVGVTNKHFRHLMRMISSSALLYTEMTTTNVLRFNKIKHDLTNVFDNKDTSFQLAGNNPNEIAHCAKIVEQYGYHSINLNLGCPSKNIKSAEYGATLFKRPAIVASMIKAASESVSMPISIKIRIGVDHHEGYMYLAKFVENAISSGCYNIIVHARKAYLKGLSPKANRTVPPLRYDIVAMLQQDFPEANFTLNGGIADIEQVKNLYNKFNSLMLGRIVEKNPLILSKIEQNIFGINHCLYSRAEIIFKYIIYVKLNMSNKNSHVFLIKPLIGMYYGTRYSKAWSKLVVSCFQDSQKIDDLLLFASQADC